MIYTFFCDGACDPNPGPMAIGVALLDDTGNVVASISRHLGDGTNNLAEANAVDAALDLARERGIQEPQIRTDSQLIVRQVSGEYQVRNEALQPIIRRVRANLDAVNGTLSWVPREQNTLADALSKRGLKPSIFPVDVDVALVQIEHSLQYLHGEPALRRVSEMALTILSREPEVISDALLNLKAGRSRHSTSTIEVARFDARVRHGETAVLQMEATLTQRSPATQLRALRLAARGLAPALVAAKMAIEKAATLPYRLRNGGAEEMVG